MPLCNGRDLLYLFMMMSDPIYEKIEDTKESEI